LGVLGQKKTEEKVKTHQGEDGGSILTNGGMKNGLRTRRRGFRYKRNNYTDRFINAMTEDGKAKSRKRSLGLGITCTSLTNRRKHGSPIDLKKKKD